MKGFFRRGFVLAVLVVTLFGLETHATPGKLVTVCPSGCDSTNLQSAINGISGSSATNIYTILLEAGIHSSDTSITLNGKSYINIVGRGVGGSILQASALWFQNNAGLTAATFLDLTDSEHIVLQDLTIDARSQDPGGLGSSTFYRTVLVGPGTHPVSLIIRSCEILGLSSAVHEFGSVAGGTVDVFSSDISGDHNGIAIYGTLWHVFSSDIRVEPKSGSSGQAATQNSAVALGGADNSQFWASHLHAEDALGAQNISAVAASKTGGSTSFVGCTLHLKVTATVGFSTRRMNVFTTAQGSGTKTNFVGSDLIYETPSDLTAGYIGGIQWIIAPTSQEISLIGSEIIDMAGSGGTTLTNGDIARADFLGFSTSGKPKIRSTGAKTLSSRFLTAGGPIPGVGPSLDTMTQQNGTATIGSASTSASVTLAAPMPDANYRVSLSASAGEVVWVTGKTTTGFTLNRTTAGATLNIDWLAAR